MLDFEINDENINFMSLLLFSYTTVHEVLRLGLEYRLSLARILRIFTGDLPTRSIRSSVVP